MTRPTESISETLRADIERYADGMETRNQLFLWASEGRLTPQIAAEHLYQVQYLVEHTPIHLDRARRMAEARGEAELATYFVGKLAEETGHNQWALNDIAGLQEEFGVEPRGVYAPSLLRQLAFLEKTIDDDPTLYLGYILFAELHIVLKGQAWLQLIEERCGISTRSFSVISHHVDLDREHTAEGLKDIDRLVSDEAARAPLRAVVKQAAANFESLCDEVVQLGAHRVEASVS